jgi:hypothetical protein
MSLRVTRAVWDHSKRSGTELVVLLAIADYVNDGKGGVAWPSVATLAKRARRSERQTQRILGNLEKSGELQISPGAGPNGTNLYKVPLTAGAPPAGENTVTGDKSSLETVIPAVPTDDAAVTQSFKEPLYNSTPVVPTGDIGFWIEKCFECFRQSPHPVQPRTLKALEQAIPFLEKKHAPSLIEFYLIEPIGWKEAPHNSRKHSPERLMRHLPEQLRLAVRTCPPPPPKKEEPPRWREFCQWKHPDCRPRGGFCDLPDYVQAQYWNDYAQFLRQAAQTNSKVGANDRESDQTGGITITDFVEAKRLICEKILREDPEKEWGRLANKALEELCKVGLPLAQIERIAWFRSVPKNNSIPELKERSKLLIAPILVVGWAKELAYANAYWQRMHGS